MKFYRLKENGMLFGLCGGIAYRVGCPSILIRLIAIILLFNFPPTGWIYLLICLLTPIYETDPKDANV